MIRELNPHLLVAAPLHGINKLWKTPIASSSISFICCRACIFKRCRNCYGLGGRCRPFSGITLKAGSVTKHRQKTTVTKIHMPVIQSETTSLTRH